MKEDFAGFMYKMNTFWLIIIAVLFYSSEGTAQINYSDLPKTNFNHFQEITSKSLNELDDIITIIGKEKIFKITIEDNTERKEFFINELKQKFQNVKFVYEVSDSVDFVIRFSDLDLKTYYTNLKTKRILGDEYLSRELVVMYSYSVTGKDINERKIYKSYKDEINIDKIEYIESGNYAFLKSFHL